MATPNNLRTDVCYGESYDEDDQECMYCSERAACKLETIRRSATTRRRSRSKSLTPTHYDAPTASTRFECFGDYEEDHNICFSCEIRSKCAVRTRQGYRPTALTKRREDDMVRDIPPLRDNNGEFKPAREVFREVVIRMLERAVSAAAREVSEYFTRRRFK